MELEWDIETKYVYLNLIVNGRNYLLYNVRESL